MDCEVIIRELPVGEGDLVELVEGVLQHHVDVLMVRHVVHLGVQILHLLLIRLALVLVVVLAVLDLVRMLRLELLHRLFEPLQVPGHRELEGGEPEDCVVLGNVQVLQDPSHRVQHPAHETAALLQVRPHVSVDEVLHALVTSPLLPRVVLLQLVAQRVQHGLALVVQRVRELLQFHEDVVVVLLRPLVQPIVLFLQAAHGVRRKSVRIRGEELH